MIRIELDELTTTDDEWAHVTLLRSSPGVQLRLPEVDAAHAKYFDLFYTWDVADDPMIDVMIMQKSNHDELYIDINNDEDLTNDGAPVLFRHDENSCSFDIVADHDENQKARLVLMRMPESPDSIKSVWVEENGNLNSNLAKMYGGMKGDFNYQGEKGTFFFDDRVSLRKGGMSMGGMKIQIGLFDYSNNGLFNDDEDVLIVDLDGSGRLEYDNQSEVFRRTDVFTVMSQNHKIYDTDKYGKWIELVKTDDEPTFHFLNQKKKEAANAAEETASTGELDQTFWKYSFLTLGGEKIRMEDYRGKVLLLNFWGEWCKPCIREIPDLLDSRNRISKDEFEIISFAHSTRVELLKKVISENGMNWPQIILHDEIGERFKISGYPTNILILKDGKTCIRTGAVNYPFIASYIH